MAAPIELFSGRTRTASDPLRDSVRVVGEIIRGQSVDRIKNRVLKNLKVELADNIDRLLGDKPEGSFSSEIGFNVLQFGEVWPHYQDLTTPIDVSLKKERGTLNFGLEGSDGGSFAVHVKGKQIETILVDPDGTTDSLPSYPSPLDEKIARLRFANDILTVVIETEGMIPTPDLPPAA